MPTRWLVDGACGHDSPKRGLLTAPALEPALRNLGYTSPPNTPVKFATLVQSTWCLRFGVFGYCLALFDDWVQLQWFQSESYLDGTRGAEREAKKKNSTPNSMAGGEGGTPLRWWGELLRERGDEWRKEGRRGRWTCTEDLSS